MSDGCKVQDDDGAECVACLRMLVTSSEEGQRNISLERLLALVSSGEIRDADYDSPEFIEAVQDLVKHITKCASSSTSVRNQGSTLPATYTILHAFLTTPECTDKILGNIFDISTVKACFAQLFYVNKKESASLIKILHRVYSRVPSSRTRARAYLGALLHRAAVASDSSHHLLVESLGPALYLVGAIVNGFSLPIRSSNKELFCKYLVDLHEVPGKISHQEPLLGVFHEPLLYCVKGFLDLERKQKVDTGLLSTLLVKIVKTWPSAFMGNSPKEILFLRELSILFEYATPVNKSGDPVFVLEISSIARSLVLSRLAQSLSSDHSYVVQAVLRMWKEPLVLLYFSSCIAPLSSMVIPALLSKTVHHWNDSVRRQAGVVLAWLMEQDEKNTLRLSTRAFKVACDVDEGEEEERGCALDGLKDHDQVGLEAWVLSFIPEELGTVQSQTVEREDSDLTARSVACIPNKMNLTLFDLVFGHELGTGSFACVRYAKRIVRGASASTWDEFAVKDVLKEHEKVALREIEVMKTFSHPNITTLIATFESKKALHLVMEYAENGDLHGVLSNTGPLVEECVRFLTGEVMSALRHIHELGYVYGDLKPENVLVHKNGHVKLGDFGAARRFEDCRPGDLEGTAVYLAPEILQGRAATAKSDYWGFGCLIFQALAGKPPGWALLQTDPGAMDERVVKKIVRFATDQSDDDFYPAHFSAAAKALVSELLKLDMITRWGYRECQRSSFFQSIDVESLHSDTPIPFGNNTKAEPLAGGLWKRRMYSLVHDPVDISKQYDFSSSDRLAVIHETDLEANSSWTPTPGSLAQHGVSGMKVIHETVDYSKTNDGDNEAALTHSTTRRVPGMAGSGPVRGHFSLPRGIVGGAAAGRRQRPTRRVGNGGRSAGDSSLFVKGLDLTAG